MDFGLFLASTAGMGLSFAVVALLRPALPPFWRWVWQGSVQHAGIWLLVHALLVIAIGRPWFAMAIGLALLMLIVQVSNAKFHSLREAFVFQDFEYFTDAIRHPRLYIPFLGWWKFALIALAVAAALAVGLWLEAPPEGRFALDGQFGAACLLLLAGALLLACGRGGPAPTFVVGEDLRRLGLLACLWRYAWAEREVLHLPPGLLPAAPPEGLPDMVIVQSESFFDPRPLFSGIRSDVLAEYDRLRAEACCHGPLQVPAWGANTVRSEFAFLSGAGETLLGVHRFNPFRKVLKAEVVTLAKLLKRAGYRTVCVHPYPASFYGRDKVYPHLGFDDFIDIRAFGDAERFGPYVADRAVSEKVRALLAGAGQPVFVFVITMENHGPLHLEKPVDSDFPALYTANPPEGCDDLTVYLRHLRNADRMMGELRKCLLAHQRPANLCWYGDHVPIMAEVYRQFGDPDGKTGYFVWSNRPADKTPCTAASVEQLSWLLFRLAPPRSHLD